MPAPPLIPDADNPMALFEDWLSVAQEREPNDYDVMSLATATPNGRPSVRMVLLKGLGPDGFVFYTSKNSRKGQEIEDNTAAALCFHWKSLRRQIRVEGALSEVSTDLADTYFASRSRESCIVAWAADQSSPMARRQEFVERVEAERARFEGKNIPRPPHWTGFRLSPNMIEFWLDQSHRMHDRLCYTRNGKAWHRERLYP